MNELTKEQLADRLNGREIRQETTPADERDAKASGLVIIFGASEDLMEFCGAIEDECDAWNGCTAFIDRQGLLPKRDEIDDDEGLRSLFKRQDGHPAKIDALWCKEGDYSWTFQTMLPHASFDIFEDGEPYCKGIVVSLNDLPQPVP